MMKARSILFILPFVSACSFSFDVTSQRTALENQVMGSYKELDDELILSGAVRGGNLAAAADPAVVARQNQMFNTDEIQELMDAGLLGEGVDGYIKRIDKRKEGVKLPGVLTANLDKLLSQENKDRQTIWRHMIAKSKNLTAKDLPDIGRSYAKIIREKLNVSQWYQDDTGKWMQKI